MEMEAPFDGLLELIIRLSYHLKNYGDWGACYRSALSGDTQPHEELLFKVKKLDRFEPRSFRTSFLYCTSNLSYLHDISYVQKKQEKRNDLTIFPDTSNNSNFWGYFISGDVKKEKLFYSTFIHDYFLNHSLKARCFKGFPVSEKIIVLKMLVKNCDY